MLSLDIPMYLKSVFFEWIHLPKFLLLEFRVSLVKGNLIDMQIIYQITFLQLHTNCITLAYFTILTIMLSTVLAGNIYCRPTSSYKLTNLVALIFTICMFVRYSGRKTVQNQIRQHGMIFCLRCLQQFFSTLSKHIEIGYELKIVSVCEGLNAIVCSMICYAN